MSRRELLMLVAVLVGASLFVSGLIPVVGAFLSRLTVSGPDATAFFTPIEPAIVALAGLILLLVAGPVADLIAPDASGAAISTRADAAEAAMQALGLYVFLGFVSPLGALGLQLWQMSNYNLALDTTRLLPDLFGLVLHVTTGLWLIRSARKMSEKITQEATGAAT